MIFLTHSRIEVARTKPILAPGLQVLLSVPKEAIPAKVNLSYHGPL